MSKRPFFLLTGDDSIRAEGIILVKRLVQDWADFQIVATSRQMSGVGSQITFPGGTYGVETVDGHDAIWVSGAPADAVFFATNYLERPIDLVISGVNLGQNISNESHRSGTVSAALTAAQCRHLKAIALSIEVPADRFFMQHTGSFDEKLLDYPGEKLLELIQLAYRTPFPDQSFWNINFPAKPTDTVKVVPTSNDAYWLHDMAIKEGSFSYQDSQATTFTPGEDVGELMGGSITLTPCKVDFTDQTQLKKVKNLLAQNH